MFTKEDLLKMKKDELVATAAQAGADITQAKTKEDIANKILEKMSLMPPPEVTEVKEKPPVVVDNEGLDEYLASLPAKVEKEGDVVTIRYHGRETCLNVNQSFSVIKRTVDRFMIDLPRPIEAQLQR